MRPALDPKEMPERRGSGYPEPFRRAVEGRAKRALGDAFGLSQFGVNLVEYAARQLVVAAPLAQP